MLVMRRDGVSEADIQRLLGRADRPNDDLRDGRTPTAGASTGRGQ